MIELPEAVVLAQQITETLRGKCISQVVANASPHKFALYSGDPGNYQSLLAGKEIHEATAYGNHVEIHVGNMLLVISTPIRYHTENEKLPDKHQLHLAFDDHSAVTCTVQMWGAMFCFPDGETGGMQDYQIAKQKPSPLSSDFDHAYFETLYHQAGGSLSAKEFLATKQRIPGLGNGVVQDILWTARVHPKRKIGELMGEDIELMAHAVKEVLSQMVEHGGRDTERDLFGNSGGYRTILSKNTVGRPCPACGALIRKEAYLGGAIYYCPECQTV